MTKEKNIKDLIILGSGPAGLSASIYASRYNIDHVLLGAEKGGYLNEIHKIENYPGFTSVTGMELSNSMVAHAEHFNGPITEGMVHKIEAKNGYFSLESDKDVFQAKNIIYSIGTSHRRLEIPGEEELLGRGVSYCATCDAPFFKGKSVFVVGGGNSAAMATLLLAEHAKHVTMIYRGEKLRCAPTYIDKINNSKNIDILYNTTLKKISGENKVESALLCNLPSPDRESKTEGVFIEIGSKPNCEMIIKLGIAVDDRNFIKTNPDQSTNISGFYAAGDITTNSNGFRQIITAASEGSIAALSVFERLKNEME